MPKHNRRRKPTPSGPKSFIAPSEIKRPNRQTYAIAFDNFNNKESNLDGIKAGDLRKVFKFMKCATSCCNFGEIKSNIPMENKPIDQRGDYCRFWNGLGKDIEICECDTGAHRCMYFLDNINMIIQIVAIATHPESKKIKR